jgi:hypothetical protein
MVLGSAALCVAIIVGVKVFDQKSAEPVAAVLQAQRQPGEPVMIVGRYVFDLPLLLHEHAPIPVVSDWRKDVATSRDNWVKELYDAGEFDPQLAPRVLIPESQFRAALCRQGLTWVVANEHARLPELDGLVPVAQTPYLDLFKVDWRGSSVRAQRCGETPTSG